MVFEYGGERRLPVLVGLRSYGSIIFFHNWRNLLPFIGLNTFKLFCEIA